MTTPVMIITPSKTDSSGRGALGAAPTVGADSAEEGVCVVEAVCMVTLSGAQG
jgi:hypothetical protein